MARFCGVLGTRLIQARPYDPETNLVERANGYLGTSFLPAASSAHRRTGTSSVPGWPIGNITISPPPTQIPSALMADRTAMAQLPPIAPTVGTTLTTRLGRDYYVSVGGNAYSVHPEAIGRMITVTTALERITVRCADRVVADHQRLWGSSGWCGDPVHVAAAAVLRRAVRPPAHRRPPSRGRCRVADLSAYDAVFRDRRSPDGRYQTHPAPGESTNSSPQSRLLKVPRIAAHYHRLAEQGREAHWSLEDYLAAVLTVESNARAESGPANASRYAGFPAIKTIGDFGFTRPAGLDRPRSPAWRPADGWPKPATSCSWATRHGKTHLATALAIAAAHAGHRVAFAPATGWISRAWPKRIASTASGRTPARSAATD